MPIAHMTAIVACLAGALALTLVLAAFLTPRRWWRRANVRAGAVLAGGTALFGALFLCAAGLWPRHAVKISASVPVPVPMALAMPTPALPGRDYRVYDDLNLRAAGNTGAARIAVVPGGATVTTTGRRAGDWWEVSARVQGRQVTGWASSLWLRRGDERAKTLTGRE